MRASIIAIACLTLTAGCPADAGPIVSWGGNGHTYEVVEEIVDWIQANSMAMSMTYLGQPGYLASITGQAEQDFIFSAFSSPGLHAVWIGLTDNEAFGGSESGSTANPASPYWVWTSGEPVIYTYWVTSANGSIAAPNNQLHIPEGEDYGELVFTNTDGTPGRWNDLPSSYFDGNKRYLLVEYDTAIVPEPTSMALYVVGLVSLMAITSLRSFSKRAISGLEVAPE